MDQTTAWNHSALEARQTENSAGHIGVRKDPQREASRNRKNGKWKLLGNGFGEICLGERSGTKWVQSRHDKACGSLTPHK